MNLTFIGPFSFASFFWKTCIQNSKSLLQPRLGGFLSFADLVFVQFMLENGFLELRQLIWYLAFGLQKSR